MSFLKIFLPFLRITSPSSNALLSMVAKTSEIFSSLTVMPPCSIRRLPSPLDFAISALMSASVTASLPSAKSGPSIMKYTLMGAVLGAVLVCGMIILLFLLNDTIRTRDDVEKYLGLSTLGIIPLDETLVMDEKRRKRLMKNKKKPAPQQSKSRE